MNRWMQAVAVRASTAIMALTMVALAVGGSGLPVSGAPAGFQDFQGGLKLLLEQWAGAGHPGTFKTDYNQPTVIKDMLDRAWASASPDVCSALANWLGRGDLLAKGITLYDPNASNRPPQCAMGSAGSLSVQDRLTGNVATLDYYVTGNSLRFKSTLPGPQGSYADPEFVVTYDLELLMSARVGDSVAISVDSAVAHVRNASMTPKNFQGEVAQVVSDIIKTFTGSGFIDKWQAQINSTTADFTGRVKNQLAIVDALLTGYAQQGFREMHGRLEGGTLALYLSGKDFQVPTSGPGKISGTISWQKTAGHPQGSGAACLALKVQATTQSGYSSASQQRFAPFTSVGAAQISPTPTVAGDTLQCAYVLKDLPTGVPLIVQVSAASAWSTAQGLSVLPRAEQSGWSGVVTVLDAAGASSSHSAPVHTGTGAANPSTGSIASQPMAPRAGANPKGVLTVSGIDFQLVFQQAPR